MEQSERPAVQVLNPHGRGGAVLVCEHASRFIPAALNDLGLDEDARTSHAAWDIGALDLATALMTELDVPLVAARISRLVYDCNRPPESADAMPAQSERFAIPGNAALRDAQRAARVREVYTPFCTAVSETLDRSATPPVMITIHSFTPVFCGQPRRIELGVLHDSDTRAAQIVLRQARQHTDLRVAMNEPYTAADGVTHSLRLHAVTRGLANVMIEIRNDLIDSAAGVDRTAAQLVPVLRAMITECTGAEAAP